MKKNMLAAVVLVGLGAGGALVYLHLGLPSGAGKPAPPVEFCAKHQITEKDCPWCDPSLVKKKGQCSEHGVPEALCTKCNPSLITAFKSMGDWCAGHSMPESQCTICNPELLASRENGGVSAPAPPSVELVHLPELPRSQRRPAVTCRTNAVKVQFRSPEIAHAAGLEYARVDSRDITQTILCNAEITYDANRYARLASRAPGVVREVNKDLGQAVTTGETLAIVDAADLGTAKAEYLQALALVSFWERNYAREKRLLESKVATERRVLEIETRLAENRIALSRASQWLRNLGLSDAQLEEVSKKQDTSSLLPLLAPFSGVVVERSAVAGEVVDTQKSLLCVADTSLMWAMLDIYESDLTNVRGGQAVVFEAEGIPGEQHAGRITWVSSHVDRRTRTLKVRTEITNQTGLLRSGMFGKAIITVRKNEAALAVPKGSVQWEGCCNVVFVKRSEVSFEPRKVKLGYETERFFVAEQGVKEGETIVTTGSFLLKTEILKGSIGAGCCEVEPGKG
jgi:cobalt-zinc-cadmium efflux system membrane fusion protein